VKKAVPVILVVVIAAAIALWWTNRPSEAVSDQSEVAEAVQPRLVRDVDVPTSKRTAASGRVTDAATGEALAGAVVQLVSLDGKSGRGEASEGPGIEPVLTGEDGAWATDSVRSGRYRITATAAGHLPGVRAEAKLEPDVSNEGLDLALTPGGNRLHGTIQDATGGTVEGALVRVRPMAGVLGLRGKDRYTTLSGADGAYAMQLPDGRVRVDVWHPDYTSANRSVVVAGGDRKVDFSLTPMGTIEGVVRREGTKEPVADARLHYALERDTSLPGGGSHALSRTLGVVSTDAAGRFKLSGVPAGTIALTAVAEGWASDEAVRVTLGLAERRVGVEVLVSTAFSIRGRVVSSTDPDRGIGGADVSVMDGPGSAGGSAETEDDGSFVMHGVKSGTRRLVAFASGYVPTLNAATVDVKGDVQDVVIELEPGLTIHGRVEPPQVAEVSLDFDPSGFKLGGGLGSGMMLTAGGTSTTSSPDGTFELRPVQPGDWRVSARAEDGSGGETEVTVTDNGAPEVVVELGARARVAGIVTGPGGAPVDGATVQLARAQTKSRRVTVVVNGATMGASSAPTDEEGRFVAAGLAAGTYEVSVLGPLGDTLKWGDGTRGTIELGLGEGEQRDDFDLSVESLDGVITGVVREAGGGPLADVWVRALAGFEPDPDPESDSEEPKSEMRFAMVVSDDAGGAGMGMGGESRPVLTDADGRFRITGLRAVDYSVVAEGTGSRSRTQRDGVRPGDDVTLELEATGSIVASVRFEGRAVTGGAANLSGPVTRSTRFDSDRVEIEGLEPGSYSLSVTAQGGGTTVSVVVPPGDTAEVEVDIEKWVRVTGRVLNKDGTALVGGRVIIGDAPEDGKGGLSITEDGSEDQLLTDEEGRFETTAGGGGRMLVVLGADVPMPVVVKPFVVAGEDVDFGDLTVDGGGMAFGTHSE
jgi:hypothetical protein